MVRLFLDGVLARSDEMELEQPLAAMDSASAIEGALVGLTGETGPQLQVLAKFAAPEGTAAHLHLRCSLDELRTLRDSFLEECA